VPSDGFRPAPPVSEPGAFRNRRGPRAAHLDFRNLQVYALVEVAKRRIDSLLVEKGLAESREKARALVMEGVVLADSAGVVKPGTLVREDAELRVQRGSPFVSRGGVKLEAALERFGTSVAGLVAADIGASTGGFTDCLLKRGASRVYAVDAGHGQIDYRLRQDPKVVVMERVNARYPFHLPEEVDIATFDLSFISLEKVIPAVAGVVKSGGLLLALVKPQFEAGRERVGKGGVVRDPLVHASVLGRLICWAVDRGFRLEGVAASAIRGADGNREFFVLLRNL